MCDSLQGSQYCSVLLAGLLERNGKAIIRDQGSALATALLPLLHAGLGGSRGMAGTAFRYCCGPGTADSFSK